METKKSINAKMRKFKIRNRFMGRAEIDLLPTLLLPDEYVEHMLVGWRQSGPALLVATNLRLLVVDKSLGALVVEDFPYDMIGEVEYAVGMLRTHVSVYCKSKTVTFGSFSNAKVLQFAHVIERKMYQFKNQFNSKVWA